MVITNVIKMKTKDAISFINFIQLKVLKDNKVMANANAQLEKQHFILLIA